MERRNFIITGIKIIPIGVGFTLIPEYANALLQQNGERNSYDINAWNDDFQKLIVKKKELHLAIQETINTDGPFVAGLGRHFTDSILKNVANHQHYLPKLQEKFKDSTPVTPIVNLRTNTNHDIYGQVFHLPELNDYTGIYRNISLKPDGSYNLEQLSDYVVYPAFHQYIGRKAYFCYGTPCEPPGIFYCSQCGQEYALQHLYYNGSSIYDNGKTYSKGFKLFGHNLACSHPENRAHGQHDGLNIPMGPIDPCSCDTDIEGVKNQLGT